MLGCVLSGCEEGIDPTEAFSIGATTVFPQNSYLVSIKRLGDKIQIDYAFTVEGTDTDNPYLLQIDALFREHECKGWFARKDSAGLSLEGAPVKQSTNETDTAVVYPHQRKVVIFRYVGKYLGGLIPDSLGFPAEIDAFETWD
jgi:hypothetical protein